MEEATPIHELPAIEPYPVGAVFNVQFPEYTVRLSIFSESRLKFEIKEGPHAREEIVNYDVRTICDGVFLVSWQEKDKSTVTHIEDFTNKVIYSQVTQPDGTFLKVEGKLLEVRGVPGFGKENVQEANKNLVKEVLNALYVKRDTSDMERFFGNAFIQHNPSLPHGHEALGDFIKNLPDRFSYEPGKIVAEDDLVMVHARMTGKKLSPQVLVDIFRVQGGKIVEHWDVIQDEVSRESTVSGMPMFDPADTELKH